MISLAAVVFVLVSALAGCKPAQQAQDQPKLVRFMMANTPNLDPAVGSDEASSASFANLYDTLVFPSPDGTVANSLATAYRVSDDGLTWEFDLRQGVKFHGGNELTAEDVAFSMTRLTAIGEGERQLVAVARALATGPAVMVLDEPTSALDVSIQAKVITRLADLQSRLGLSYLFITHDLNLMRNVASRVAIMYLGKVSELAPTADFFRDPLHPYTRMLLSAIPVVTAAEEELKPGKILSRGEIPSPVNVPPGCSFGPRCPEVMPVCSKVDPAMTRVSDTHWVRCHLYGKAGDRAASTALA